MLEEEDVPAILAACRENPAAFSAIYKRYLGQVYRYLSFHVGSQAEAEDLTSQVFLAALEGLSRYRHRGFFAAWLFGIARRKVADHYRRPKQDRLEALLEQASLDPDPLAVLITEETKACLVENLVQLPEKEQELLRLRYAAALGFDEIAILQKRSPAAVKMALYRLLHRLEKQLEPEKETSEESR